ncbi:hypothetical protein JL108_04485 [Aeromicrobium sp. YIM 150415]|uniref:hypothetical protein n=1 Tax=Aeromicrobium sp. YIM 150415 TaxID=2803912 RepID=UPI001963772C|nr:hypothetical protein [Aeromicrobium sp. YIM 150415]MBM9462695.1 hypothetical protein [Aeromicrobium sp. YIM 150415]
MGTTAVLLLAGLLVGCADTSSDDDDASPEPAPQTSDASQPPASALDACSAAPEDALASINPRDREPVSTLLIGDLVFDGCTLGDVYSMSFGVRMVDDGRDLSELVSVGGGEAAPLEGVGDEAFRSAMGGEPAVSVTVGARFGDHEVIMRNDAMSNSNPENVVTEQESIDFLIAFGESLPRYYMEQAMSTRVGEGCPVADDVAEILGITVQLARGGTADDAVRCTYLGGDLTTVQLARFESSDPETLLGEGDDLELSGTEAATIDEWPESVEIHAQLSDNEMATVRIGAPDDGEVDADGVVDLAEEFTSSS